MERIGMRREGSMLLSLSRRSSHANESARMSTDCAGSALD